MYLDIKYFDLDTMFLARVHEYSWLANLDRVVKPRPRRVC